jgi:hypothetical protein
MRITLQMVRSEKRPNVHGNVMHLAPTTRKLYTMENPVEKQPESDIATEPYKGPGPTVTSFGYSFIDWHAAWLGSILVGVGVALVMPKHVNNFFNAVREGTRNWKASENLLKKPVGWFSHAWLKAGEWSNEHFPGRTWLEAKLGSERWSAAATAGGILTAFSFITTIFTGTNRGIQHATAGKNQFDRAKSEIKELRAENTALREKYAELKVTHETETGKKADNAITPAEITADTDAAKREPMPQTTIQKSEANVSEPALAAALEKQAEAVAAL